jgi:hypothetical protein
LKEKDVFFDGIPAGSAVLEVKDVFSIVFVANTMFLH